MRYDEHVANAIEKLIQEDCEFAGDGVSAVDVAKRAAETIGFGVNVALFNRLLTMAENQLMHLSGQGRCKRPLAPVIPFSTNKARVYRAAANLPLFEDRSTPDCDALSITF